MTITQDEIRLNIQHRDKWLYRALMRLYSFQTEEERLSFTTKNHNNRGFNSADAKILTSFAEFYKKTGFLTPKQKQIARHKLAKYSKQLYEFVQSRGVE